jgi:hypothetical protein
VAGCFSLRLGWLVLDGGVILGSNYVICCNILAERPQRDEFFFAGDNVDVRVSCCDCFLFLVVIRLLL